MGGGQGLLRGHGWRQRALALTATGIAACSAAALAPASPARADIVRSTEMWVLNELNMQPAWSITQGKGVIVAVIDSGVDGNVTDLTGNVLSGPNFSGVHTAPGNPNWGVHGTWMASLIAGHGNGPDDDSGIIGTAPESKVLSIRVITDSGDPHNAAYEREPAAVGQSELAEAITYAVTHHAQVISMSLGYSQQSRPVRAALQDAYEHNVVVVASAGNSGEAADADGKASPYSFPANYPGVLGVAAVNSSGQVASFSSQNLSVQVAAPGYKVPAQGRDDDYWYVSGTSPACALTAGVVALIKAAYPHLTDSQVISAITSTTTPSTRPPRGYNEQIGFGVVDAAAALTAADKLAAAAPAPAGMALSRHFGGGLAAIPVAPVPPRGPADLVLYCLLGAAGLAVVAFATSKLLAQPQVAAGPPVSPGGWGGPGASGGPGTSGGLGAPGRPGEPDRPGEPGGPGAGQAIAFWPGAGQPGAFQPGAFQPGAGQPGAGRSTETPPTIGDEGAPGRHAAPRGRGHHWPGPS
jgi:subtilisin family serine protease